MCLGHPSQSHMGSCLKNVGNFRETKMGVNVFQHEKMMCEFLVQNVKDQCENYG